MVLNYWELQLRAGYHQFIMEHGRNGAGERKASIKMNMEKEVFAKLVGLFAGTSFYYGKLGTCVWKKVILSKG